ncbi:type IV secretion system DNA-binding domain-containing protein [Patescibacteria group bacterium]|nr:type IV secretion system DNA-binding domain-containing protein [Patescibacteria group bacterium]
MLVGFLFQYHLGNSDLADALASDLSQETSWLWPVVGIILALVFLLFFLRFLFNRLSALRASLDMVLLLVLLPREIGSPTDKDHKTNQTPETIEDQMGVAEVLWSALGGLKPQSRLKRWFMGGRDHLSFEMVYQGGLTSFYVAVPKKLRIFLEQQIQSSYPYAILEEVADYNIFSARGVTAAARLRLSRSPAFPIKTYKQFDSDTLNGLTNGLAKIPADSAAAVQLVVRSAHKSWRRRGVWLASQMQQGKSLVEAAGLSWGLRVIQGLGDFFSTVKKNKAKVTGQENYRLSPLEEEMVKGLEQKAAKAGLDVVIRLVVAAPNRQTAESGLHSLVNSFAQFNFYQYGNSFKARRPLNLNRFLYKFIHRVFDNRFRMVLNTEELTSLYHFPLPNSEAPNIRWLTSRKAPPPNNMLADGVVLGTSEYRGTKTEIKLSREDRARHFYVCGKSGTGKSVLIENMAVQDAANGEGLCVIDPHGDLVEAILGRLPAHRLKDVILFDPTDSERPQGLNLLEYDPKYPEQKSFVINEMIKILDKLYDLKQTGGPMFEQYMRNAMLLIMEDPESGSTLMEIPRVLADADYRRAKLAKVKNPVVYDFWVKEAQKAGGEAALANMVPYITSKLTQFVANDLMRPIIGQQTSAFNLRQVMDERKILLVKLSKGKLGDTNAYLLGLVMVGKILMAALSRTDVPKEQRPDFYLYIDEFQNFITDSIATILSEARKYRLNLIIAHQYIGQLVKHNDTSIRDAVFGNVGTIVSFRVGVEDSEFLAKEFSPVFTTYDLINLELYNAYAKLLINNIPSRPFNFKTLAPPPADLTIANRLKEESRQKYGKPRQEVEQEIINRVKASTEVV